MKLKTLVATAPVLKYYDVKKPVTIQTDASQFGLGAVIIQDGSPVVYASRSLDNTQQKYAVIEKELLAISFACIKFHHYIFGKQVDISTDHKSLVEIVMKPLHECTSRIQRIRMKLLHYNLKVSYLPGEKNVIADFLSRNPTTTSTELPELVDETLQLCSIHATDTFIQKLQTATAGDATLQKLMDMTRNG
jgi:hypothetical protein